uniref:Uncharacterized protein n=1 Tax=Amphimedon queenslandica TaxID=400682 RepID=A0A1X7SKL5_AMPQE
LEVQSTGVKEATNYAGLVYYEEKGAEDLITFTAAKKLDALLEFIEKKHPKAKLDLNVYFRIASPDGFIELKFDAPQDEPFTGWSIKPRMKPCRDYPLPPSCPISVYGLPDAVPTLNYSVPLEGVVHSVTLYIHASLKTNPSTSSSSPNTVTESNAVSSTGGASASATVDVDQVKKVINSVLVSQFAALSSLPKEAIPKLANELYAVHLINSAVRDNPSVEKFIDEFKASLTFMAEMSDVQEHCLKFLNSFLAVSGSFAIAAKFLYQKWIEAIKTELGIDFIININF